MLRVLSRLLGFSALEFFGFGFLWFYSLGFRAYVFFLFLGFNIYDLWFNRV